jgi:hypothetical protein
MQGMLLAKCNRNAKEKLPDLIEYNANMNLWIDVIEVAFDSWPHVTSIDARTEKRLLYSKYACRCGEVASYTLNLLMHVCRSTCN